MESGPSDPWRLSEALAGNSHAWNGIVEEFSQSVWNWARGQGLSREDAEDVSQTVWYRLKDNGRAIRDPRTLPGWLATTTRREAIRVGKRRNHAARSELDENVADATVSTSDPAQMVEVADLNRRLAAGFTELRPLCRELLSLCWNEELSYREIAEILDRPIGSIGPTRQRCLDDLRVLAGIS